MRKVFFLASSLGLMSAALAQTTSSKSDNPGGFYLKGGVNLANISTTSDGRVDEAKMLTSFHIGGVADIPLNSFLSFQPGLLVTGKGSKTEIYTTSSINDNYFKIKTNPIYLELPANLVFKAPLGGGTRLFFGAGPYIAMGIGGETKGEQKFLGVTRTYEKDVEFNDDDPTTSQQEDASVNSLRRFDYGANGLAGIETGKFMVGVNYGLGLSKIGSTESNENDDDKNKHRVFSISLGIGF